MLKRTISAAAAALVATAGLTAAASSGAMASGAGATDFEGFSPGSVNGQDGWVSLGSAGSGCAQYDHEVVSNTSTAPAAFGAQSLRISNAVTSGCFGDQTFSSPTSGEAGETTAQGDGSVHAGPRLAVFDASWDVASTSPGSEQPGLSVVVSPDRGDGARMSWLQMADGSDGLAVNFYDFQDGDFVFTPVASGLDRATAHRIRLVVTFLEGPGNDVVDVYVDGVLAHTGTTWEDYFREVEGTPTRAVDSLLFRTAGTAAPATAGAGFLLDNVSMATAESSCATATDGTTITLLADCVTTTSIEVPDGFTFDGDGHTVTAVDPAGGHFVGGVITNEAGAATVNIVDVTVTVDNLANQCDGGADRLRGILLDGAGGTIAGTTVSGINQGASGCQEGNAIEARNAPFDTTGPDRTVTITDNVATDYQKTGILVSGSVKATLTGNQVTGAGPVSYIAQNGIQIGFGATAVLRDNASSGNYYTGADLACGVLLYQADGVKVSRTTYSGNEKDLCNVGKGGGNVKPLSA